VKVTDEEVQASILATPGFQKGGAFDDRIYKQVLRFNKLTPEDFEFLQKNALIMTGSLILFRMVSRFRTGIL